MANRPKLKPTPERHKGKEYLTYEEAMEYLGIRRSKLYTSITNLHINARKFPMDSKHYIAIADVKKIQQVIEKPWTIEQLANKEI